MVLTDVCTQQKYPVGNPPANAATPQAAEPTIKPPLAARIDHGAIVVAANAIASHSDSESLYRSFDGRFDRWQTLDQARTNDAMPWRCGTYIQSSRGRRGIAIFAGGLLDNRA
jgi:hypothetical protein